MTCHSCRIECKRHGRDRKGNQRFQCRQCSKTFLEPQEKPLDGMYLRMEKAELVLSLLLEGNSISSVVRLTRCPPENHSQIARARWWEVRTDHG